MNHKRTRYSAAFTLVELIVVIGIIAIIAGGSLFVGKSIINNAKNKNTRAAIRVLTTALDNYREVRQTRHNPTGLVFPVEPADPVLANPGWDPFESFDDFNDHHLIDALNRHFHSNRFEVARIGEHNSLDNPGTWKKIWEDPIDRLSATQINKRIFALASIEYLYVVLNDTAQCRDILNNLPEDMVTNYDNDGIDDIKNQILIPLYEVNDAWGRPLRYRSNAFYDTVPLGVENYPTITSAGPDGIYDTDDDISSDDI